MSIFQNALASRQAGMDEVANFRETRGRLMAGNALAQGNPQQAANALYKSGQLDLGEATLQRQEGRQMRQQANQWAQEDRQASQDKQAQEMRAMALMRAAEALKGVPAGQRLEVLNSRVAPMLGRLGMPVESFAGITEDDLSDQGLSMFVSEVKRNLEVVKGSDGSYTVLDMDRGGEPIQQYQAPRYQTLGQGQSLVEIGGQGGGQGGDMSQPRNMRNNNPGNIEDGPFARSLPGYKGSDGRFAIFDSPQAGTQAQIRLLQSYGQRGLNTVQGIIGRWAPASDGNDVAGYSRFVAQRLGVSPDQPLNMGDPQTLQALAGAIQQFEGGPQSASNGQSAGGARVIAQGAPKPGYRQLSPEEVQAQGLSGRWQQGPDGQLSHLPDPADRPPTEGQINGASLAYAAFGGNERMNQLAKQGLFKPETATAQLFRDDNGVMRLVARTEKDRLFIQAAKEFLAPILRKDSGAAVTATELAYYMDTYIPRFEDSPAVLWQKAQARDTALRRVYGASRRAYDQEYGAPGKWQVLTDPRGKPQSGGQGGGQQAPAPPKVGEVRQGYRFKGGDPAKPSSWERAR